MHSLRVCTCGEVRVPMVTRVQIHLEDPKEKEMLSSLMVPEHSLVCHVLPKHVFQLADSLTRWNPEGLWRPVQPIPLALWTNTQKCYCPLQSSLAERARGHWNYHGRIQKQEVIRSQWDGSLGGPCGTVEDRKFWGMWPCCRRKKPTRLPLHVSYGSHSLFVNETCLMNLNFTST